MTAPITVTTPKRGVGARFGAPAVMLAAAAIVGFLLVGQLSGTEPEEAPLAAETEEDLARILANLNSEADALQTEIAELRVQLSELRRSTESEAAAAETLDAELRNLAVLAGTTPVTGPGVVMTIEDPDKSVAYDALIDVVQELRDAGAEAVAVNDHRVGVASAFSERDKTISLDGVTLRQPFRVAAIGQPATLDGGLKIPGGAVDAVSALKGVRVSVERLAKVDLPALDRAPTFRAAEPVR